MRPILVARGKWTNSYLLSYYESRSDIEKVMPHEWEKFSRSFRYDDKHVRDYGSKKTDTNN